MTIRIPAMNLAMSIDVRRGPNPIARFGRSSGEPVVRVALLIGTLTIATSLAQVAGGL